MMSKNQENGNPLDAELLEKIELMRDTPRRDTELASRGKERYLAELESLPIAENKSFWAWLIKPLGINAESLQEFSSSAKTRKLALSTLTAVVFACVLLFGGFSATAYASQTALPGDALFPIKTSLESTQVNLARDAYAKAQLQMRFAQRRLDDINLLLEQGRLSDVALASSEFEAYIQSALNSLETVMAGDAVRGAELSNQISQTLLNYAIALKNVLVTVPDTVKPAVEKALLLSQDNAGEEIEVFGVVESISDTQIVLAGEVYVISNITEVKDEIEVGDTVKIHVIMTMDGAQIAREIEGLSGDEDLSGDNADEKIGDDNDTEDEGDDNANEDENMNTNEEVGDGNTNDEEAEINSNDDDSEDNSNSESKDENQNEEEGNENDNSGSDNSNDGGNDNDADDENENNANDDDRSNDNDNSNDNDDEEEEEQEEEIDD
jgi:hypothetical protein